MLCITLRPEGLAIFATIKACQCEVESMPFPRDTEEFRALLESHGVESISSWIRQGKEMNRAEVAQYLFLDALWRISENPNDSSYTREKLARNREREDHLVPRIETVLDAGIEPKLISEIVLAAQLDLLFDVLYMLDDNEFGASHKCSDELCYGLFEAEHGADYEKIPKGESWSLNDMLAESRPATYPSHPRSSSV